MGSTCLLTLALSHHDKELFSPLSLEYKLQGEPDWPGLQQTVTPDSVTLRRIGFPVQAAVRCLCGVREARLPLEE